MLKRKHMLLLGLLAFSGSGIASGSGDDGGSGGNSGEPTAGTPITLKLAPLIRPEHQVTDPVIDPASLSDLALDRGRVRLPDAGGLNLSFLQPLTQFSTVIDDPRSDSAFELRWYRGSFPVGAQRFAPLALGLPDTLPLEQQALTVHSAMAFDRVQLLEIHGAAAETDPETITAVTVTLAPPRVTSENLAKGGDSDGAAADTNTAAALCQLPLGLAYNIAFGAGLVAVDPIAAKIANSAAYTANLGLKFCKTVLIAPKDLDRQVPAGTCSASWAQERMVSEYENALGIALPFTFDYNWGALGTPFVYHHNTEVEVGLYYGNPTPPESGTLDLKILIDDRALTTDATDLIYGQCDDEGSASTSTFDGVDYACPFSEGRTLEFPVGRNTVLWRANAKVSPLDLVPVSIPGVAFGVRTQPYKKLLTKIVSRTLTIGADTYLLNGWRWGNTASAFQRVTVWDEVPPTIDPQPQDQPRISTMLVDGDLHVQIEADEPGGVSRRNYERLLSRMYNVFDACDRDVTFFASYPTDALRSFWPVSTTFEDNTFDITWTARDPGPNLDNERNETIATMTVEVVDIRPPAIVPPPDIVEITTGQVTELGQPLVFDFVDLDPAISNDADLPLGQGLHVVTWTATDASGNSAEATQIVNVKNSNLDPTALAQTGTSSGGNANTVVSFEPTPLRLEGNDPDGDPLRFTIEEYPAEGFFVAPLYPYFVEDFRVATTISNAELTESCEGDTGPGTGPDYNLTFPLEPTFFAANDDGLTFVLDRGYVNCNDLASDKFRREQRIAKFDGNGTFIDAFRVGDDNYRDVVVDDLRQRLYLTKTGSSGASLVRVLDFDLNEFESFDLSNLRNRADDSCSFNDRSNPCRIDDARSAVLDSNGLLYVMDLDGLIYTVQKFPGNQVKFVALVSNDVTGGGSRVTAGQLALDSTGNLYASRNNRIYKYAASAMVNDEPVPGSFTGWLGRCDTDLADGDEAVCDVRNRRSLGFSCTDDTCGIEDAITQEEKDFCGLTFSNLGNFGCRPGQFRGPRGIDLDPRDNLYVADSANERIQRFSPEGFFAGEAESACDGSCFVLGDFGKPRDISVNSSKFFILDPQSNLLHISLLTPFTDMGPDWAELVYQSDNDFACANPANCIDRFEFSVSDGVRDAETGRPIRSAPATVEVRVGRNFRPPVATPGIVAAVAEDTPIDITLDGAELDPLDTLSFVLVEPPENGTVTISGDRATYQGQLDFTGEDRFLFAASDGASQSDPEPVTVTVLNVNDAPRVSPLDAETTGAGFTYRLAHDFRDPDTGEAHLLSISWGDGTVELDQRRDSDGNATGPVLDATGNGLGRITADHVYTTTGPKLLEVCVTDQVNDQGPVKLPTASSLTDCATMTINVIEARDLALSVTPSTDTALPGQFVSYDFEVSNLAPSVGPGSPASGIAFTLDLAEEFEAESINVTGTGCSRQGFAVRCNLGALAAGASSVIRVTARVPNDVGIGVSLRSFADATMDQADQTPDNDLLTITPVVRPGDHLVGTTGDALRDRPDSNPGDGICASADGVCTLRAAFDEANASPGIQVIVLGNGVYRIEDDSLPGVGKDIVVLGNGPQNTLIDGNDLGRIFAVAGGGNLRIEDVTIANTVGPAIQSNGQLTVRRSRFTNNYARFFYGGAIFNDGNLELRDVTFDGNRTDNDGGAVWSSSSSTSNMVNVTAYGNEQSAFAFVGGTHTLTNVTITGNTGGTGWEAPAAALNVYGAGTVVTITNTVLIDNEIGPVGGAPNCSAQTGSRIISGGNNVFGDLAGCDIDLQPSDRVVSSAQLELAPDRSSGLTTLRPLSGSLLIDRGQVNACPDTDARGVPRPQDGNDDGSARCDIGAVERRSSLMLRATFE